MGGAAVAGSLIEFMSPYLQNAALTGSDKEPNKEDIRHSALVYAIMGAAFKGMRDISKMGKVPVENDGKTNAGNDLEAQRNENTKAIDSQVNILERIRQQTRYNIQNGIAYDEYTLNQMDEPKLRIILDTLKAANDIDMKNKGYTPEQIKEYGQQIDQITNKSELKLTIRNWQDEMGFKENDVQLENPDNLNNLDKNDIMQSSNNNADKVYNANGDPNLRAQRRIMFDQWKQYGLKINNSNFILNEHAYNSLFKSGRKNIMPADITDALLSTPIPAENGCVEYLNSKTNTSVYVNLLTNKIVGIWPGTFKK